LFGNEIQPLIVRHGYLAVFLVVMLEGMGSPLPGETALVLAAIYAGATGHLNVAEVIMLAMLAAMLGGSAGFWLGRSAGSTLVERYGRFLGLNANRLALGRYLFQHHGGKIVFFGRFIAVLRVLASVLAGLNKYDWRRFFIFNAAGAMAWALIMGLGGYFFGNAMRNATGPLGIVGLIIAIAGIFAFWLWFRQQEKKMEQNLMSLALAESEEEPEVHCES